MQQLALWPAAYVTCEHCGQPTQVKTLFALESTTARVYKAMCRLAVNGRVVNAADVAELAHCHRATAARHLEQLHRLYHLVEPVKKRQGGLYRAWKLA